jgi:FkbM family methyltransferase
MSYSQHDEERFILKHTPQHGRFLDVGAWHATELSNTRALYERGWGGVVVEPSPGPARALIAEYGGGDRVHVICAAVAPAGGLLHMHASDEAYTTAARECARKFQREGQFFGRFFSPAITIEDILEHFGRFEFVNLDVEGGSVDLLRSLLQTPMNPYCICVEHDDRLGEVNELICSTAYLPVHANGTNIVLARR